MTTLAGPAVLDDRNISLPAAANRGPGLAILAIGLAGAVLVLVIGALGLGGITLKHAVAMYHVGAMSILAAALGGLFFTMLFHLMGAGWAAGVRRQCENLATFLPFAWLLVMPTLVIEIATHGQIFAWLNPAYFSDHALQHKAIFFYGPLKIVDPDTHEPVAHAVFPAFFIIRALFYGVIWTFLSRRLAGLSRRQDTSPDPRALAAQARFTSAYGMLLFAITLTFAAFDWLMSVDFKFFSTMWPVWYFAASAFSGMSVIVIIAARLRAAGRVEGVITREHFHDMGKILLSFVVFWAYISFSQYFLIWYSNIPEETAYYFFRTRVGSDWRGLGIFIMLGHFIAPFVVGLFRGLKKSPLMLGLFAAWGLVVHFADIYFVVRPMVEAGSGEPAHILAGLWLDVLAMAAMLCVLAGYLMLRIPALRLVPIQDPLLGESLEHRNYV